MNSYTLERTGNDSQYMIKYLVLWLFAISFVLFGFLSDTPAAIAQGILKIITEPAVLITDYIVVGGIGAAFVNAGTLMLVSIFMLLMLKIDISGISIASVFLMGSFALFGKNICNIWPIIFGVYIYSKLRKEAFRNHIHIAFLATSISPIVTELLFVVPLALWIRIFLSIIIGISVGVLITPLASNILQLHKGFNLYNIGFSVGILGTIYVSVLKSYGYTVYSRLIWSTGNNQWFGMFLFGIFMFMMVTGSILNKGTGKKLFHIFKHPGVLSSDFVALEGFGTTLMNMGLNGLIATGYVVLVGGELNGPTIGGILTVSGFGAFGKHVKNIVPIFAGVLLASTTKTWNINDPGILLAALFGTSLAPIAGQYGWVWGIVAGFMNSSVVLNSGILHGGMNLYNTGFSAGIVATVMVPLLNVFSKKNLRVS